MQSNSLKEFVLINSHTRNQYLMLQFTFELNAKQNC